MNVGLEVLFIVERSLCFRSSKQEKVTILIATTHMKHASIHSSRKLVNMTLLKYFTFK